MPTFEDMALPMTMPAGKDSARIQRENQLKRFRAMFEHSPSFAAIVSGPEHRLVALNPAFETLFCGATAVGKMIKDILSVTELDLCTVLKGVNDSGQAFVGTEVRAAFAVGTDDTANERWLDFVCQPVRDDAGEIIAIFVEGVDVTERRRTQEEIRRSETWNRQILDGALDHAIIALDLGGRVTRWNAGAVRTLGWTESEMLGRSGSVIFTADGQVAGTLVAEMRAALDHGRGGGEGWRVRKSGERFWASGEMTPIRDEAGQPLGFVKVLRDRTQEYVANEALRRSDEMLERAQEAGGVGVFAVELEGSLLTVTPEFCRIFGVPIRETMPARLIEQLVLPEDEQLISDGCSRSNDGTPLTTEYRIVRPEDGQTRWVSRRAEYECDAEGRRIRMVGVVQDITAQREASEALAASEARFRAFTEAVPNQVWSAMPDGSLDWANRRTSDFVGVDEVRMMSSGWDARLHPEDVEEAMSKWRSALQTGDTYEAEFRLRDAAGHYRWHLARAVPLRDEDGSITRWIGTNTDIEDRRRASDALSELNVTLEERVDRAVRERDRAWKNSRDLQVVISPDGRFQAVNDAWQAILGYSASDVVGRSYLDFIHPDDERSSQQALGIATADELAPYENRYRHADGGYRWISWVAAPEGGMIYASGRHVTADKEAAAALEAAQDQLRQAQKMEAVGQLTGGVAHDFNNLLTVIRGSVELLERNDLSDARRRRYIQAIGETAERASKLTGQLLAFARRQSLTPEVFDVGESLRKVVDMVQSLTGSSIALKLDLPPDPCHVLADRGQFDTAIVNMAINARDAMAGEGTLSIGVGSVSGIPSIRAHAPVVGSFVAVTLADTGSGIQADDLQRVFEPFFTTKAVGSGTGLGLSQVIGFAKQSGGDIRVESTVGAGTTFTLYLPRASVMSDSMEADEHEGDVGGDGVCVLVVEDNEAVGRFATDALRELGYDSILAVNGAEALEMLEQSPTRFHVVFSDVVMPGIDGLELAARVRSAYTGVPVVLTSGYSHVLAQNGTHGFELLHKPYSIGQLSRVLRKAVDWGVRARRGSN